MSSRDGDYNLSGDEAKEQDASKKAEAAPGGGDEEEEENETADQSMPIGAWVDGWGQLLQALVGGRQNDRSIAVWRFGRTGWMCFRRWAAWTIGRRCFRLNPPRCRCVTGGSRCMHVGYPSFCHLCCENNECVCDCPACAGLIQEKSKKTEAAAKKQEEEEKEEEAEVAKVKKKKHLCKYWRDGNCDRGEWCGWAHCKDVHWDWPTEIPVIWKKGPLTQSDIGNFPGWVVIDEEDRTWEYLFIKWHNHAGKKTGLEKKQQVIRDFSKGRALLVKAFAFQADGEYAPAATFEKVENTLPLRHAGRCVMHLQNLSQKLNRTHLKKTEEVS
jgi:hypothetical protein